MSGASWHVVERKFTGEAWDPDTTPWREIALLTGPESYEDAVRFARLQTTTYTHPARYRVLAVVELEEFERPATVGPLGPDDGLCRCTDSVRSAVGTCPRPGDPEYGHCPKRKGPDTLRPMELLVLKALGGPDVGRSVWREAELMRPEIELPGVSEPTEEDPPRRAWTRPAPRPQMPTLEDNTLREWDE